METKQVSYESLSDQEKFLANIRKVQNEIVGFERYGNEVEFFDEDGAVVLSIIYNERTSNFDFNFGSESFMYNIIDPSSANEIIENLIEGSVGEEPDYLEYDEDYEEDFE